MHLLPILPKKYIIKFIRANLSAKYINEEFKIPVIHLIRNPFNVIQSQLKVNFPWLKNLDSFVAQADLVSLIQNEFGFDITNYKSLSTYEIFALRWCIENVIPLEVLEPYGYKSLVVKYESLINDMEVFYNICSEFNIDYLKSIQEIYNRPSSKTHPNNTLKLSKKSSDEFSPKQYDGILKILDVFNTKLYSEIDNITF